MKEKKTHVLRAPLPWRPEWRLSICGRVNPPDNVDYATGVATRQKWAQAVNRRRDEILTENLYPPADMNTNKMVRMRQQAAREAANEIPLPLCQVCSERAWMFSTWEDNPIDSIARWSDGPFSSAVARDLRVLVQVSAEHPDTYQRNQVLQSLRGNL